MDGYLEKAGTARSSLDIGEARKRILIKIFVYYGMDINNATLKEIWEGDLIKFGAEEIEYGFEAYRRGQYGDKKPKSLDIVKCIEERRRRTQPSHSAEYVQPPLIKGASATADLLIKGIETMKRNNPNLDQDLRNMPISVKPSERIYVCAAAMGEEDRNRLLNSQYGTALIKMMDRNAEIASREENGV